MQPAPEPYQVNRSDQVPPDQADSPRKVATDPGANSHAICTYVTSNEGALYSCLASRVAQNGIASISADQIHRSVMAGLLPSAGRVSLGRGRGFRFELAPGTYEQLLALCRFRRVTKSADRLRMLLWLEGWPVDQEAVRRSVLARLPNLGTARGNEAMLDRLSRHAAEAGPRLARRLLLGRIGRTSSGDGADVALQMAFGLARGISPEQAIALESVTGVRTHARSDRVAGAAPWLTGETSRDLTRLARAWSIGKMRELMSLATSDELERARPFARALAIDFPAISRANDLTFGRNFAGWRLFRGLRFRPEVALALAVFFGRMGMTRSMSELSAAIAEGREITRTMIALGEYYVAQRPEQRSEIRALGIDALAARGEITPLSADEQAEAMAAWS